MVDLLQPFGLRRATVRVHRGPRAWAARRAAGSGVARSWGHSAKHEGPQGKPGGRGDQGEGSAVQTGIQDFAGYVIARTKKRFKFPIQRQLIHSQPASSSAAPWVKVYLVSGKRCMAKAKTTTARRTLDPLYQQQLVFHEKYSGCVLQVN